MKRNLLQGRALTAALFVLLLSLVGMKNALAQNQVATLQHNDTITGVYYGENAFVSAYDNAVAGDVITLSSGTFNGCNIQKSLIIHGAGCAIDTVTNLLPTILSGNHSFYYVENVTIEGIRFTGTTAMGSGNNAIANNITFTKCFIDGMFNEHGSYRRMNNCFVDCIIKSFGAYNFVGTSIINSVVEFTQYYTDFNNGNSIQNSIIQFKDGVPINNLIANNSIITTTSGHSVSNCTFINCIGIETGETLLFEGQTTQNVMEVNNYLDVFETFDGTISFDNIYQLKSSIATSFLGNDGTEVGIYGGIMPYKTRPSYLIMKHCNVAPRSTVDGKLSVDIEILTDGE